MSPIEIRILTTADEMHTAVELQKAYWGDDMADLVPEHMLLSISKYGGHVHGAFIENQMIGMVLGFLGADIDPDDTKKASDHLLIMSKRMVVLPGYRGHKIGEQLKWAQRDYALQHNIQLVSWTFDPVLARNAYLNLHKLAAVGQAYAEDFFGARMTNPVLNSDRLVMNWWVSHPHVQRRAAQQSLENLDLRDTPVLNCTDFDDAGFFIPLDDIQEPDEDTVLMEIPRDFSAIEGYSTDLAQHWRNHIRQVMHMLFDRGYIATDFVRLNQLSDTRNQFIIDARDRVFYVFTRDDGTFSH